MQQVGEGQNRLELSPSHKTNHIRSPFGVRPGINGNNNCLPEQMKGSLRPRGMRSAPQWIPAWRSEGLRCRMSALSGLGKGNERCLPMGFDSILLNLTPVQSHVWVLINNPANVVKWFVIYKMAVCSSWK